MQKNTSFADTGVDDRCGSDAGYRAHCKRKEITCQPCRDAHATCMIQWKKIHPDLVTRNATKYRVENPEKVKAAQTKYRSRNPAKIKARKTNYYTRNSDVQKAVNRQWKTDHPEKCRESSRRRKARKRGNGFEPYTEAQVLEKWGTDCYLCGEPIDMNAPRSARKGEGWERGLHMEHVIPISKDGPDTMKNVRPSHALCNLKKHAA